LPRTLRWRRDSRTPASTASTCSSSSSNSRSSSSSSSRRRRVVTEIPAVLQADYSTLARLQQQQQQQRQKQGQMMNHNVFEQCYISSGCRCSISFWLQRQLSWHLARSHELQHITLPTCTSVSVFPVTTKLMMPPSTSSSSPMLTSSMKPS
jgi:hypothetical protein